ncbi:MAG TPA: response regulator [Thermoanaerobaculia bacterium]|nr:response regulator [Thermoanaerobaculia bacterium]
MGAQSNEGLTAPQRAESTRPKESRGEVRPRDPSDPARAPADILVVDDDARNLAAIEVALGDLGRRLVKASSGPDALRQLLERDFALILLDIQMPGMDGFETAQLIRQRKRSSHVPIIFVTAYSRDDREILHGYSLGAVDFLFKPIVPEVLRAKASVFVELQERTAEVLRHEERLRDLERQEHGRRLAAERQRWEAEALREENRRKDQFIALLAHELRNPLSPLVTGLELMRHFEIDHDGLERVRCSMSRQVAHLARLVDDLLDASRISQGKIDLQFARHDLCHLVEQAIESVRPQLEEQRHELSVQVTDDPLVVEGDGVRLVQVISNLLNNAIRYTPEGGSIRVSCAADEGEAVLRVADTGRGIAPEMAERIFEMFVQEREGGKGLGLGLTLVKQLVDLHEGSVKVFSRGRGHGSEFIVRLPRVEGDASAPDEEVDAGDLPTLRVAVVEDEADVAHALQALLESWGQEVRVVSNGRDGVELIRDWKPDLALMDIAMPGLDGYGAARELRETMPPSELRLVALTGFGRSEDRRRARRAGFDDHLVKPAAPSALRRVLRSQHDGESRP